MEIFLVLGGAYLLILCRWWISKLFQSVLLSFLLKIDKIFGIKLGRSAAELFAQNRQNIWYQARS
jgi:hypothetical protein